MNYLKNGVQFDDYHSIYTWGLITTNIQIGEPEVKTTYIDIPGASGVLDLTEAGGEVNYKTRTITLNFTKPETDTLEHSDGYLFEQKISRAIHGQKMNITFDSDKTFYWSGRVHITDFDMSNKGQINITVEIDADPYKYDVSFDGDKWLWDTFDFNSGIINVSRYEINGSQVITLINRDMPVSPTITASAPMTVMFNSKEVKIKQGTWKVYDIRLKSGENNLTFKGNGTIEISYKAGVL